MMLAVVLAAAGCGGSTSAPSASTDSTASRPSTLPQVDAGLRAALRAWQSSDPSLRSRPPAAVLAAARRERELIHAARSTSGLHGRLQREVAADIAASHKLRVLTGPPVAGTTLHLVQPVPAGELLADYRRAQRRFGVPWQVLAAVNFVESAFGRVTNHSSAGAQGPMQFMPATWKAYGLGGNVHSPRDAILGAANYLHRSGAPGDIQHALYAYNPSHLYVDAVLAYARQMRDDPLGFLTYYAWEASLPSVIHG